MEAGGEYNKHATCQIQVFERSKDILQLAIDQTTSSSIKDEQPYVIAGNVTSDNIKTFINHHNYTCF